MKTKAICNLVFTVAFLLMASQSATLAEGQNDQPEKKIYSLSKTPKGEAPTKAISTRAKVVIDFPGSLQSRDSYHNISGPVWVFTIKFKETNGIAGTITAKRMRIYATDGKIWGDNSFVEIFDSDTHKSVNLVLEANGEASYTGWVNDRETPCTFCGGTMLLEYQGKDANGNLISCKVKFALKK